MLINADEEIGSPGSRSLITQARRRARCHDVVRRRRASESDKLSLATGGIALGHADGAKASASHAGARPERGVNALYELALQIVQMRDLSDPEIGLKMNWTHGARRRARAT